MRAAAPLLCLLVACGPLHGVGGSGVVRTEAEWVTGPSSAQVPHAQHATAAATAAPALSGELAGELHFRMGEWDISGPFRLVLALPDRATCAAEANAAAAGPRGAPTATVTFRAAALPLPEFGLSDLHIEAEADLARNRVAIRRAEFSALGGHVALRPFEIDLATPENAPLALAATAELRGLALAQLASFIPEAVREASGRVSGTVQVSWSEATGLQLGTGALHIEADTAAHIHLAAMPGFLTQHTTPRFVWLPPGFGRLARWLALDNPAYGTLAEIETGTQPLRVETLHVALYPDGPDGPRSAAVHLTARPTSGAVVKQLRFDINLSGPLDQVLRLGTSDALRLNFGKP